MYHSPASTPTANNINTSKLLVVTIRFALIQLAILSGDRYCRSEVWSMEVSTFAVTRIILGEENKNSRLHSRGFLRVQYSEMFDQRKRRYNQGKRSAGKAS